MFNTRFHFIDNCIGIHFFDLMQQVSHLNDIQPFKEYVHTPTLFVTSLSAYISLICSELLSFLTECLERSMTRLVFRVVKNYHKRNMTMEAAELFCKHCFILWLFEQIKTLVKRKSLSIFFVLHKSLTQRNLIINSGKRHIHVRLLMMI